MEACWPKSLGCVNWVAADCVPSWGCARPCGHQAQTYHAGIHIKPSRKGCMPTQAEMKRVATKPRPNLSAVCQNQVVLLVYDATNMDNTRFCPCDAPRCEGSSYDGEWLQDRKSGRGSLRCRIWYYRFGRGSVSQDVVHRLDGFFARLSGLFCGQQHFAALVEIQDG
eukprot:2274187-Amphidinium_carterae.1